MNRIGLSWIFFGYVLLSAVKGVHVSIVERAGIWSWQALLFYCFALVTAGALTINIPCTTQLLSLVRQSKREVVEINVSSAVMWGTYFYAASLGDPTIYAAVALGGGPTLLLLWRLFSGVSSKTDEWIRSLAFTLGVVLLLVPSLKLGLVNLECAGLGVLGGIGVIWMVKTNGKMNQAKWTPSQVLSVRFWGLVIATGVVLLVTDAPRLPSVASGWFHLASIVIYGQFIALYSLHHGIGVLIPKGAAEDAKQHALQAISVTMASMPILMFLLQIGMGKIGFTLPSFIGVCLVFGCKLPFAVLRSRDKE